MTNDELERIMSLMAERQERITEQQEQMQSALAEMRLAFAETQSTLAETQSTLAETQSTLAETQSVLGELARRDDDKAQRIARFERSYIEIAGLLAKHDDQLVAVTSNVNKLTEVVAALSATVDRYIMARGNNGSGG